MRSDGGDPLCELFGASDERECRPEERPRQVPMSEEEGSRRVEHVILGEERGGHPFQAEHIGHERHVVGVEGDAVASDECEHPP